MDIEEGKKYERPEKTRAEFTIPLLKFKQWSDRRKDFDKLRTVPSRIEGMNAVLGGGYVRGTILNMVGFPKAGKSTYCIHEALLAAADGKESLIMFNESPFERYMETLDRHRTDLKITEEATTDYITFANAHEKDLKSASYDYIDKMAVIWIRQTIEQYLTSGHKPTFVIFDSLTKFYRTWAAQSFRFVQATVYHLHDLWKKYDVHPITLAVHQVASAEYARDDSRVFGGRGITHEMDGSIVISFNDVDTWFERSTGFPMGTRQRFIRADSRFIKTDEMEYHFIQAQDANGRNRLKVGLPLPEIVQKRRYEEAMKHVGDAGTGT